MKNIYLTFTGTDSTYIDDVKENFKHSKAWNYLKGFEQENNRYKKTILLVKLYILVDILRT